jgi:hypothetical protein
MGEVVPVSAGVRVTSSEADHAAMVLGQLELGNVPVAWSGMPLLVIERVVPEQDHVTVLFIITDALLLNALYA